MRVFKYKKFARFAKKQRIADAKLCEVVKEIEAGINRVDLGGNVFKQRVAREGQGKSGSYRTIVFYKFGELVFFVHGFLKADEENITVTVHGVDDSFGISSRSDRRRPWIL